MQRARLFSGGRTGICTPSGGRGGGGRGALRVLLIDDNPDDRALALRELRRGIGDVEATEVGRPEEFARAMADFRFDVVVTDFQLKWNDGISVLRAIKSQHPDVPVVMFTGSGSEEI